MRTRYCRLFLAALLVAGLAGAEQVQITILQTTDIHGRLEPDDGGGVAGGGWLRLATLIRRERQAAGERPLLLIDCGDTVQGTLAAVHSQGGLALTMLNVLAYDVWVLGNHELDFGAARLAALGERFGGQVLAGNFSLELAGEGGTPRPVAFDSWRLFEMGGARIAVIGMQASYLDNWFWGPARDSYRVGRAVDGVAAVMPAIRRQRPDLLVLAIHQGWLPNDTRQINEVEEIAKRFPEIDLILGGHTHWPHPGRRVGRRSWYVQSGRHADGLAVIKATVDTGKRRVLSIHSELRLAGPEIEPDTEALAAVSGGLAAARAFGQTVIGELVGGLTATGAPGVGSGTSELISAAIAAAAGIEVAVHGKLSTAGLAAGPVDEAALFAIVPYENNIGILHLTPAQLLEVVTEQVAQRDSYVACGLYGIEAVVGRDKQATALRFPDGRALPERLPVAFNSYSLAGGGGRFPVLRKLAALPEVKATDTGINSRDAVRAYLAGRSPLDLPVRRWLVGK